jgi:hypothetical protein
MRSLDGKSHPKATTTEHQGGTNMKPEVGMKVTAYKSRCIGILIQSETSIGEIIKVNKKSIRVVLTETTCKFGKKVTGHWENLHKVVTYKFSKTLENGQAYYRSESLIEGGIII